MSQLERVMEGLHRRTAEGRLKWEPTVAEGQFVTAVDAIAVAIQETKWPRPKGCRLEILDEEGRLAEVLDHGNTSADQYEALERLYAEARRSALSSQITLEKLAKALEA
ncbi:MAG: hypothetical protein OXF79_30340 [Chloroflexi bacterium]|nr:hypothetical protein [Chloroflexota bacterium]